jgi:hypothetical protein
VLRFMPQLNISEPELSELFESLDAARDALLARA